MRQDKRISKCNRSILRDDELLGWFGQVDLKEALKPVIARVIEIIDEMPPKLHTLPEKVDLFGGESWIINTLSKGDLTENMSKKEIEELTDDDMHSITSKMSDGLMESYWIVLECAVDYWRESKKNK